MALSEFPSRASMQSFSRPRSIKIVKDARDAAQRVDGGQSQSQREDYSPIQRGSDNLVPDQSDGIRQDSAIDLCSIERRQSQASKVDTVSLFSVPPDEIPCEFSLFDSPPGARLSRPFMMPVIMSKKRESTISRRSVVSVEILADIVKSKRITQDSDTLSPTCLSPGELQQLYADCIDRHPAFLDAPGIIEAAAAAVATPSPVFESPETPLEEQSPPYVGHLDPAVNVGDSSQRSVMITRQSSKVHLQHKCSILYMDRLKFSDRLEASNQDLANAWSKLGHGEAELSRRKGRAREVEAQVAWLKNGMERAMRAYRDATKELVTLKQSHADCAPSMPAQVLSSRQRKIHSEYRLQQRHIEKKLSTTMAELRSVERKWKEAQLLHNSCCRSIEKQTLVVRDRTEDLRIAEAAKVNLNAMLNKAQEELRATRDQLADVEASTSDALASSKEKARRFAKRVSQIEAECENSRSKLEDMKKKPASLSAGPDETLVRQLVMVKRELKDREELLGVVKKTNSDLARKIADMETQLGGRKHWNGANDFRTDRWLRRS